MRVSSRMSYISPKMKKATFLNVTGERGGIEKNTDQITLTFPLCCRHPVSHENLNTAVQGRSKNLIEQNLQGSKVRV